MPIGAFLAYLAIRYTTKLYFNYGTHICRVKKHKTYGNWYFGIRVDLTRKDGSGND